MLGKPSYGRVFDPVKSDFIVTKRTYTVTLIYNNTGDWKIRFCPDCRNAFYQYKGDMVTEMPGSAPHNIPIMLQCKNPNCGRKEQIQAVAYAE